MAWECKTLSSICQNLDSQRVPITKSKRKTGNIPYYGASGIVDYVDDFIFDEDLLLVSEDGANLLARTYAIAFSVSGKTWVNNHAHVLRFKNSATRRFVEHYLNSISLVDFVSGMAQPKLNQRSLNSIPIPLPSIEEQKFIVAVLDQAFSEIEKAQIKAKQNLENAKELFDSCLQQTFSSKHSDWDTSNLKSITAKIGSGATPKGGKAAYKSEGISLIRSMNVHDRQFKDKDLALIDDEQASKLSNVELFEGDVLLNITGASVARCCVVPHQYLPARVNQHVSIIRLNKNTIKPELLCYLLTSKYYKDILLGIGEAGSTRQAITKTQIENFEISFPKGVENQDRFIRQLSMLEDDVLELQRIYTKKLEALDELKKSILQKAFNGELIQSKGAVA